MAVQSLQGQSDKPPREANIRWLWGFLSQHRFAAFASLASGVLGGITLALEPYFVGIIIDHIRQGIDLGLITRDVLLLMGLSLLTVLAFFGQRHYSGLVAYSVHYDVRKALFHNMILLDQKFYQRYSTGDLISRMFNDLNWVWRLLALTFNRGGSALVVAIMGFVLLATVNLTLTLLVFAILAVATAIQIRSGLFLSRLSEHVQDQAGVMTALIQDSVTGIQTIKTFGRETGVASKFDQENMEYRRRWLYYKRRNEPVGMFPQMVIQLTTGVVVLIGGQMTLSGEMTLGNFAQFILYLALIRRVMLELGTIYQRYVQTVGALKRLSPLLQEAGIRDTANPVPLPEPRGEITFENVSLKIGDDVLLKDIDLHIEAGKVVALVGPTGCGKTLMVNLLARIQDPTTGRILIDGVDARDLQLDDLRKAVAYVPQTTFLFSMPLHENIRMGRPEMSEEELVEAIHISRMSNDLPSLPDGLDTMVGEKGVMLSGGQQQRVAIARAIARDPSILVLDDALSSVDTQTAADILHDMRGVLRSRTSIIIAHRIATVQDADWIFVMNEGRIVEQGTHHELLAMNGYYAAMAARELAEGGEYVE